jgi:hypothetical protein
MKDWVASMEDFLKVVDNSMAELSMIDWFTIDWDSYKYEINVNLELAELHRYMELSRFQESYEIVYRISARGGVHVLVRVSKKMTKRERFDFRREFKDDPERLKWDILRAKGAALVDYSRGVLFDAKMIPHGGEIMMRPSNWATFKEDNR